ncbi:hypothetical protein CDIK_3181 [Cucumispora dikerogammari]|nr:hypothetical protein CDIK_3181 [Cucumispora dikerogammari]
MAKIFFNRSNLKRILSLLDKTGMKNMLSLSRLFLSSLYQICYYFQDIKLTSNQLTYIKLKDMLYDGAEMGTTQWYDPKIYKKHDKLEEFLNLGSRFPLENLYLKYPLTAPFVVIPLFEVYYPNLEDDFGSFISNRNLIHEVYETATHSQTFSFKESNSIGAVKSIKLNKEEVYLVSTDDREKKSSFLFFTSSKNYCSVLCVGAFLHKNGETGSKKLNSTFEEYFFKTTKNPLLIDMSLELIIDITELLDGITIVCENKYNTYKWGILSLSEMDPAKNNTTLLVKMIGEIRDSELGFKIEKYIEDSPLNDKHITCVAKKNKKIKFFSSDSDFSDSESFDTESSD